MVMVFPAPPRFLSRLRAEKLADGRRPIWRLIEPLVYVSAVARQEITVPVGFETDFASVPRLPLVYLLAGNTAHEAAVLHDYLYRHPPHGLDRRTVDDVFYEAMTVTGEPRWRRVLMWLAVRTFGQWPWDRYRNLDRDHDRPEAEAVVAPAQTRDPEAP